MQTLMPNRKHLAGFSLVELAIVILIAGILLSAGLSLLSVKLEAAKLDVTQKHQEAVKQALINYLGKYRRLPCPTTVANGGAPAPPPPCTSPSGKPSYSGIVPYYELGLDRAAVLDGWENFITYVVSPNPIAALVPTANPPWTTAWLYSYSATSNISPNTTTGNLAFWPSTSTGGITVTDGTNPIADPTKATGAAVALISYGKNGYGAFNVKGGKNAPPPAANIDEQQNTSPVSGATPPTETVVKRDTTDSTAGGGPFDDIVMMLSANDLTGPLIANGTLQSSAQAALSQANDIVMGNIVASRSPVPIGCSVTTPCTYTYNIPNTYTTFPPSVTAWGVSYALSVSPPPPPSTTITVTATNTTPSSVVGYTLTAADRTSKTVSVDELRGILTRGAGFN